MPQLPAKPFFFVKVRKDNVPNLGGRIGLFFGLSCFFVDIGALLLCASFDSAAGSRRRCVRISRYVVYHKMTAHAAQHGKCYSSGLLCACVIVLGVWEEGDMVMPYDFEGRRESNHDMTCVRAYHICMYMPCRPIALCA